MNDTEFAKFSLYANAETYDKVCSSLDLAPDIFFQNEETNQKVFNEYNRVEND